MKNIATKDIEYIYETLGLNEESQKRKIRSLMATEQIGSPKQPLGIVYTIPCDNCSVPLGEATEDA